MRPRFAVDLATVLAAGFLAAASFAFTSYTAGWIGFGVFVGILVAMLAGAALPGQIPSRGLHLVGALVAGWSVVASLVYVGSALSWLVFGGAAALAGIAIIGLVAHELSTERVVHTFEVSSDRDRESSILAA